MAQGSKDGSKKPTSLLSGLVKKVSSAVTEHFGDNVDGAAENLSQKGRKKGSQVAELDQLNDAAHKLEQGYKKSGVQGAFKAGTSALEDWVDDKPPHDKPPSSWKQKFDHHMRRASETFSEIKDSVADRVHTEKVKADSQRHKNLSASMREKYQIQKQTEGKDRNR